VLGKDRHGGRRLAGIDLALWLAGEIGGRKRAEAIQLVIE